MGNPLKMVIFAITTMLMLSIGLYVASTGLSGEAKASVVAEDTPEALVVDWDVYSALETGMSFNDVIEDVGWEGDLFHSANLRGRDGQDMLKETYTWHNDDGSRMTCIFENQILTSKEEYNLL